MTAEEDYGLDLHGSMLLEEYRSQKPVFEKLQEIVMAQLRAMVTRSGMEITVLESRVKGEASLAGKLQRKGAKYSTLSDITDIFGARLVAFYNEDVERISSMVEQLFDIDWPNSVDKRKMHQFDSFGYNSLHYICRLPASVYHDEQQPQLNQVWFELQMRTALQHAWSAIQHDIGYKNDVEIPVEYHRALSRLAGMLELADLEFSRIRADIVDYRRRTKAMLEQGCLEKVELNGDSFAGYMQLRPLDELNRRIAAINQAELQPVSAMPYLGVLKQLGLETVADVARFIAENQDDAYQLALYELGGTDIDILADSIGLQNVVTVAILKGGGAVAGLKRMFDAVHGESSYNERLARSMYEHALRLSFMNK